MEENEKVDEQTDAEDLIENLIEFVDKIKIANLPREGKCFIDRIKKYYKEWRNFKVF